MWFDPDQWHLLLWSKLWLWSRGCFTYNFGSDQTEFLLLCAEHSLLFYLRASVWASSRWLAELCGLTLCRVIICEQLETAVLVQHLDNIIVTSLKKKNTPMIHLPPPRDAREYSLNSESYQKRPGTWSVKQTSFHVVLKEAERFSSVLFNLQTGCVCGWFWKQWLFLVLLSHCSRHSSTAEHHKRSWGQVGSSSTTDIHKIVSCNLKQAEQTYTTDCAHS